MLLPLRCRMACMCRGLQAAGVSDLVTLHQGPCHAWQPPMCPDLVVCNPPWGNRLQPESGQALRASRCVRLLLHRLPDRTAVITSCVVAAIHQTSHLAVDLVVMGRRSSLNSACIAAGRQQHFSEGRLPAGCR